MKKILACTLATLSIGSLSLDAIAERNNNNSSNSRNVEQLEQHTDRLIIRFSRDANARFDQSSNAQQNRSQQISQLVSSVGGQNARFVRDTFNGSSVIQLERRMSHRNIRGIARALENHPDIEMVELDTMMHPAGTPNDSLYSNQWHYFEATGGLNVETAWDSVTGSGVVVAVLDTGYRPHADLAANLLPGYDMISDAAVGNDGNGRDSDAQDPGDWTSANQCYSNSPAQNSSWHGTHVAGTIAAVTNNGSGVAGVAYGAKVVPVRVLGTCGGYTSDIADGIVWAAGGSVSGVPSNSNPAQVINMSLGGGGSCNSITQQAIDTARGLGATIVVAAGNSNANTANYSPASCAGVITVAATNRQGGRAYYSNYGADVDVAAPGGAQSFANDPEGVLSTLNSGTTTPGSDNYEYFQGTSMAAPHVAGAVALLYEADPGITPTEVETALETSARSFPSTCSQCGSGIVDATAAVELVSGSGNGGGGDPGGVTPETITYSNISGSRRSWQGASIVVPEGATSFTVVMSGGSGDADLYVNYGSQPSSSNWDCRPYLYGNNESCTFSNPTAGTWYYSIYGYRAYSGVTLVVSYE